MTLTNLSKYCARIDGTYFLDDEPRIVIEEPAGRSGAFAAYATENLEDALNEQIINSDIHIVDDLATLREFMTEVKANDDTPDNDIEILCNSNLPNDTLVYLCDGVPAIYGQPSDELFATIMQEAFDGHLNILSIEDAIERMVNEYAAYPNGSSESQAIAHALSWAVDDERVEEALVDSISNIRAELLHGLNNPLEALEHLYDALAE